MADKINELITEMTKAKALELLIEHVDKNGIPEVDTVVYTERIGNDYNCWTYQGLCKFIISE